MSLTAATISATSISDDDRRRAEKFIAADQDSPLSVFLQNVLAATARGADIGLVADDAELSPNQAAELLKMSRPHLLSFMDRGDLRFYRVGTHRRIKMTDLREFMAAREAGAELVANAISGGGVAQDLPLSGTEQEELDAL
ncbi:helix-turn-helix domain-containing protein [Dietzia sp. NPDC055343]